MRNKYLHVVRAGLDGSALDPEEGEEQFEEQDLANDVESYSDEEDMDMQVIKAMILILTLFDYSVTNAVLQVCV